MARDVSDTRDEIGIVTETLSKKDIQKLKRNMRSVFSRSKWTKQEKIDVQEMLGLLPYESGHKPKKGKNLI